MPDLVGVVGGKSAKALGTLGITTLEDLLAHYPRRYAERGELTDLASLKVGEQVTVLARVASAKSRPLPSKPGQKRSPDHHRGGRHRRDRGAHPHVLQPGLDREELPCRAARAVRRDGGAVQRPAPAAASRARVRRRGGRRRGGCGLRGPVDRGLPGDGEGQQLDHRPDRAHGAARGGDVARPAGRGPARPRGRARPADGAAVGPPADRPGPGAPGDRAAAVGRGVRRAGRPRPAAGCDHGRSGDPEAGSDRWPARRVRRGAAVHPDRRASWRSPRSSMPRSPAATPCTASCRGRSARARPWWRCGRCCESSTPVGRRPCLRPPRCWPRSTPAASPRCSGRWPRAGCSVGGPTPRGSPC